MWEHVEAGVTSNLRRKVRGKSLSGMYSTYLVHFLEGRKDKESGLEGHL